jgi:hypothetical protein
MGQSKQQQRSSFGKENFNKRSKLSHTSTTTVVVPVSDVTNTRALHAIDNSAHTTTTALDHVVRQVNTASKYRQEIATVRAENTQSLTLNAEGSNTYKV